MTTRAFLLNAAFAWYVCFDVVSVFLEWFFFFEFFFVGFFFFNFLCLLLFFWFKVGIFWLAVMLIELGWK
jgi:hypothetical protein